MSCFNRMLRVLAAGMCLATTTAQAQVTLRVASEEPFGQPPMVAAQYGLEYLAEKIPEVTNGDVQIELYPGGAIGTERELIRSVASGTVDAIVLSPGNAAGVFPEVQLFSAPYLFDSYEHAEAVLRDEEFLERFGALATEGDLGFEVVGLALTGTRNFYNRVKPIDSIEDMQGMKMRVQSSPTEFTVWSTLGLLPTTIPAPEIYTALQTGVVDAAESSLPAIAAGRYYEVAPYITLTRHNFNVHLYLLGDSALAKIPEEHHDAVRQVFREAAVEQIEGAQVLAERTLEALKSNEAVTVSEVNVEEFRNALESVQSTVAQELEVEPLLEMIRAKRG